MTITTIDGVLFSLLSSSTALRNIVGSNIFVGPLADNCSFPALSIFKISNPYSRISGYPRFQVSCWGYDLLEVKQLANVLEAVLDGWSGIVSGWNITRIIPLEAPDLPRDTSTNLYQIPYDFLIMYKK